MQGREKDVEKNEVEDMVPIFESVVVLMQGTHVDT